MGIMKIAISSDNHLDVNRQDPDEGEVSQRHHQRCSRQGLPKPAGGLRLS